MCIGRMVRCERHEAEHQEWLKIKPAYSKHDLPTQQRFDIGQRLLQAALEPVCDDCVYIIPQ